MKFQLPASEWHSVLKGANSFNEEAVLNLKEQGLMLRVQDSSQTGLYNTLIPSSVMETYEIGEYPRIGIYVDDLYDITPNDDEIVTVELEDYKIKTSIASRQYYTPNIDPESVASEPEFIPDLEMPITINMNPEKLMDFISEAYSYVYNNSDTGDFYIQAQEGTMVLWSKRDDYEFLDDFHWEDFDDYSIDWNKTTTSDGMSGNPSESKQATSVFSVPLTKSMVLEADTVRLEMGHGMPLKIVYESEAGVKYSWIIPPRFPRDDQPQQIPESIINKRVVVA